MKKSSSPKLRQAGLVAVLLVSAMATPLAAQSPDRLSEPMSNPVAGQLNGTPSQGDGVSSGAQTGLGGYGQQQQGLPLGAQPMNDPRVGQFLTGTDIPQTSPTTEISPGDLLDIVVFETPELSGRFRVNPKGDILLPLAGALHVGGLNVAEITDAVAERYKTAKILVDPQVTVFVSEFTRRTITITGEVRSPSVYTVGAPRTLIDTLAMAGGLSDSASRTISIVHAADPTNIIHVTVNVGAQTPESIRVGSMPILPGDKIFVARSGLVYMVGELLRPGSFQADHNNHQLSALEALALAGGPTRLAKLGGARLIRRSETGREEIKIDLQKILYGGGPDVLLTDGDIVYVPTSLRKQYGFQVLDGAVGAATTYAIYRIAAL